VSTENFTSSPVAPGTGTDDFAASRVPPDRLQSAWDISLVRMGLTVSASDLVFGYTVGLYFSFWQAIGISLLISAIVLDTAMRAWDCFIPTRSPARNNRRANQLHFSCS